MPLYLHPSRQLILMTQKSDNRIATFTDSNSINGESSLTFDGTLLSVDSNLYVENSIYTKPNTAGGVSGGFNDLTTSEWDTTFFTQMGETIKVGTAISTTGGYFYNLTSTGWVSADADATSTSTGLIGVAIASSTSNTFLVNGYILLPDTQLIGSSTIGAPAYISTTAGRITFTAPTGSGDVVRIVGHCVDKYSDGRGNDSTIIRFNPSNDWIELT